MREYPQLRIRLTPELKDKIQEAAHVNGRSMNAEISLRLEKSFEQRKVWVGASEVTADSVSEPTSAYAGDAPAGAGLADLYQAIQETRREVADLRKVIKSAPASEADPEGMTESGRLKGRSRAVDLD